VEQAGEVWVVSGDYKVATDGLSEPFAPVACHAFISECTFGLPVFNWQSNAAVMDQINHWWATNAAEGRASIIAAYALGKAQRIMAGVDASIGPIITHGAVEATNAVMRAQGIILPPTQRAGDGKAAGALVIAPPSALGSVWAGRFGPAAQAFASGWMALRGVRRRRGMERGFVISDHADWAGLNDAIRATGAERVFVTHGYTTVFRKWLESQGYDAGIVATEYEGERFDAPESDAPEPDAPEPGAPEPGAPESGAPEAGLTEPEAGATP
jgi:putative mRNA 3-end processing factor